MNLPQALKKEEKERGGKSIVSPQARALDMTLLIWGLIYIYGNGKKGWSNADQENLALINAK